MTGRRRDRDESFSSEEELRSRSHRKRGDDHREFKRSGRSTDRDRAHRSYEERAYNSPSPSRRSKNRRLHERNGHQRNRSRSPRRDSRDRRRYSREDSDQGRGHRDRGKDRRHSRRRRSVSSSQSRPARRSKRSESPPTVRRSKAPLPSQNDAFKGTSTDLVVNGSEEAVVVGTKQKPNFAPSGKLAAETNTVAGTGIILKYNEPPESRKPPASQDWRLYVFKGSETLDVLELSARSCWLFGRERSVVDYATEHPSCSKQHAVLQFRFVEKKNEFGDRIGKVKPYVIDLESANGTKINGQAIPERRFVEVQNGDVLVFGDSTREYVLMLPPAE